MFTVHLKHARGDRVRRVRVYVNGKRVKVRHRHGRIQAIVHLRSRTHRVIRVRAVGVTRHGKHVRQTRRYRACR